MQNNQEANQLSCINDEEQALLYERTPTPLCRICYESEGELLKACDCSGTQGLVHRKCLKRWITDYAIDKDHCEICKQEWQIDLYTKREKCWKRFKPGLILFSFYLNILFTLILFDTTVRMPLSWSSFTIWMFTYGILGTCNTMTNYNIYINWFKFTSSSLWMTGLFVYLIQTDSFQDNRWKSPDENMNNRWDYETFNEPLWFITIIDISLWVAKAFIHRINILLRQDEEL
tara:strand:+ start:1312 stop:2004 length:693 start_codon:yes stop_codon:yes gene_type:complete